MIRLLAGVPLLYLIRGRSSQNSPEFSSITILFSARIRLETRRSRAPSSIYHRLRNRKEEDFRPKTITLIIHKGYSSNYLLTGRTSLWDSHSYDRKRQAILRFSKLKMNKLNKRQVLRDVNKSDPHLVSATSAISFSHRECSNWRYLSASWTARETLYSW